MEKQTLTAEVRKLRGKGPARQLRMGGKIPAVLYGPGGDTLSISIDPASLTKALMGPYRRNQLLELDIAGDKHFALAKDLDVHPVTRAVRHADFYRVALDRAVSVEVPLRTHGRSKGVTRGGELRQHFRTLPVRAVPEKVPSEILVNVEELDMLESVRVKDLPLGEGVTVELPADRAVILVTGEQRKIAAEEPEAAPAPAPAPAKGKK
jgi:large subunit ribosomal protein L25